MDHECAWTEEVLEETTRERHGLLETDIVVHPACRCGKRQPTKRGTPRAPTRRRLETARPAKIPRDDGTQAVAKALLANGAEVVPWRGCRSKLIQKQTDAELETSLAHLTLAGWIRTHAKRNAGAWTMTRVEVLAREALEEHVRPGLRAEMAAATSEALADLPPTPTAQVLREHIVAGAPGWEPETIRWAARLVRHAAQGQQVLVRQFSAAWDLSKAFQDHRAAIERVLGDVTELGLTDTTSLLFVGGRGTLVLPETTLEITPMLGILGLERATLHRLKTVCGSPVVFIENQTVFEAVAKDLVPDLQGSLAIFTGGNVGPAIRHAASVTEGETLVWADLDPEGVRIARHVYEASGKRAKCYRMTPDELAPSTDMLDAVRKKTLEQELARKGPLRDLLQAIQATGKWREQERQLQPAARPAERPDGEAP